MVDCLTLIEFIWYCVNSTLDDARFVYQKIAEGEDCPPQYDLLMQLLRDMRRPESCVGIHDLTNNQVMNAGTQEDVNAIYAAGRASGYCSGDHGAAFAYSYITNVIDTMRDV